MNIDVDIIPNNNGSPTKPPVPVEINHTDGVSISKPSLNVSVSENEGVVDLSCIYTQCLAIDDELIDWIG